MHPSPGTAFLDAGCSAAWGAKPDVERDARRGNMGVHSVEDHFVVFIFIKAQIKEGAHRAAGLRNAIHYCFLNKAGERIS